MNILFDGDMKANKSDKLITTCPFCFSKYEIKCAMMHAN